MSDPPTDPNGGTWTDGDGRGRDDDRRDRDTGRRRIGTDRRGRDVDRRRADADRRRHETDGPDGGTERHGIDRAHTPRADDERGPPDAREGGREAVAPSTLHWLSGVVAVVGLWIAASAFVYDPTTTALWNNVATGGAILLLAGYGAYRMLSGSRPDVESTGLAALLGLWAVVAPLLLGYGSDALVWSTMASGVAVAILSGYSAYESRRTERARTSGTRA